MLEFGEFDFKEGSWDKPIYVRKSKFESLFCLGGMRVVAFIAFFQPIRDEIKNFNIFVIGQARSGRRVFDIRSKIGPNEEMVFSLPEFPLFIEELNDCGP